MAVEIEEEEEIETGIEEIEEIETEIETEIEETGEEGTEAPKAKMFAIIAVEKVTGKKVVWIDDENEF
jgi:hypothetical protein